MGTYKETRDYNEPGDIEVAYFEPSFHPDNAIAQGVAVAPLKNNEVSVIMNRSYDYDGFDSEFIHMIFTEKEVDMLIDALLKAKKKWVSGEVY